MPGIVSCGLYIPRLRIKREEYVKAWGYFSPRGIEEKAVADFDEDPITMGVEAASNALKSAKLDASEIDAVYFASTSPPYVEKGSASTLATALACKNETFTVDVTSTVKAGASALLACLDYVASRRGRTGLVIAADCPHGDPTSPLEHQFGAAATAMIVTCDSTGAVFEGSFSIMSESIGERFRRNGQSSVTRVDVGPYHDTVADQVIMSCIKGMMSKLNRSPKDYDWLVLQGTDDAKALELSKKLGFEDSKTEQGMISAKIGDTGAASSLLALSRVFVSALSKQHVILCSYGPGSGADGASFVIEGEMKSAAGVGYDDYLAKKEYIDYTTYLKLRRILGRS